MVETECKQCSKKFHAYVYDHRGKYCSRECYYENKRKKIGRECKNCGINFIVQPWRVAKGEGVYCSKSCSDIGRTTIVAKKCLQCEKHFKARESHVTKGWGLYCSRQCQFESMRKQVSCTCEECGNKFYTKQCYLNRGGGKFCSWKCCNENRGIPLLEEIIEKELQEIGMQYESQKKFGKYHVDFFITEIGLVIECDDKRHNTSKTKEKDIIRDKWFKSQGYKTVRLKEKDILKNPKEALMNKITQFL